MAPGPRASFGWAVHKGTRAFLFGGVSDNEARGGEDLSSEFHNDLYTFSALNRWGGAGGMEGWRGAGVEGWGAWGWGWGALR
jgi:hypothetical protein